MQYLTRRSFQQQVEFLRQQFLQGGDLPFSNVLSEQILSAALAGAHVGWVDRIYTPLITLWVFLAQVLSADHSCRAAVARLIAHRVAKGQKPCSSETGAYCLARKRLPERIFSEVTRQTGSALETNVDTDWLWKQRRVYVYDGSTVSMPDTPDNQHEYPQPESQKPGLGFPLARIAAMFSLASGAVLDLGICRYAGKGQSELGLLRSMWDIFCPGDVMLADSLMCSWFEMALLKQRGIETVCRLNKANRSADFRRGRRLGLGDHIVQWPKPKTHRSVDRKTYNSLPEFLSIREIRFHVEQPGFRSRNIIVVTTMLDTQEVTMSDLAQLYRARWNAEIDLKSLKQTMQMDVLRCKTPEMVRKEIWTHLLAYNLIRTIIAQAATKHGIRPRSISFKGALQTLEAFQPVVALLAQHDDVFRMQLYQQLLDAIEVHRVADRPDRFEPRRIKRRQGKYDLLTKPRREIKLEILKRVKAK